MDPLTEALIYATCGLTSTTGVLAMVVLNLRHQVRTARAQADWCAGLATRAKQALEQAIGNVQEVNEQLELKLHRPQQ